MVTGCVRSSAREAAEASTNAANNAINAMTLPASEAHQHATREQELAMYAAEEAADVARRLAGWLVELSGLAEAKMANVKEAISTLVSLAAVLAVSLIYFVSLSLHQRDLMTD